MRIAIPALAVLLLLTSAIWPVLWIAYSQANALGAALVVLVRDLGLIALALYLALQLRGSPQTANA